VGSTGGRLDQTAQAFVEQLLARFPAWRAFASLDASGAAPDGTVMDVPSPTGEPDRALRFWIERGVPSVEYGTWHTHQDLWPSQDAWFAFIEDILCDRALFVVMPGPPVWWFVLEDPVDEELADVFTAPSAPREVRVVSWSGALDRVVTASDISI
jgi:hypothetical protein